MYEKEIRGPENAHSTNGQQESKQTKLGMEVNWEQESTAKPKQYTNVVSPHAGEFYAQMP